MTGLLVVVVIVAVGALLAWASVRQREHAGEDTMDEVKARAHRRGVTGSGSGL